MNAGVFFFSREVKVVREMISPIVMFCHMKKTRCLTHCTCMFSWDWKSSKGFT